MKAMKVEETPGRLREYVSDYGKRYPGLWRVLSDFRQKRGQSLPRWRECCYVPMHAAFAYLTSGKPEEFISSQERFEAARMTGILTALGTWRLTQGIYRFHPELFSPVWNTPISGELPVDLLFHFPEWCVYVETPGQHFADFPIRGFFAHIDDDLNYNRAELRLVFDTEGGLDPFVLHLNKNNIFESIESVAKHSTRMTHEYAPPMDEDPFTKEFKNTVARGVSPLVSLLLYISSATKDTRDSAGGVRRPGNPNPKKVKGGTKIFPAERSTIWETGYRMGAALGRARSSMGTGEPRPHAAPSPHVRRAHWHSFWQGPKSEPVKRSITIKWLPPIPVGVGDLAEIIPTIRLVE